VIFSTHYLRRVRPPPTRAASAAAVDQFHQRKRSVVHRRRTSVSACSRRCAPCSAAHSSNSLTTTRGPQPVEREPPLASVGPCRACSAVRPPGAVPCLGQGRADQCRAAQRSSHCCASIASRWLAWCGSVPQAVSVAHGLPLFTSPDRPACQFSSFRSRPVCPRAARTSLDLLSDLRPRLRPSSAARFRALDQVADVNMIIHFSAFRPSAVCDLTVSSRFVDRPQQDRINRRDVRCDSTAPQCFEAANTDSCSTRMRAGLPAPLPPVRSPVRFDRNHQLVQVGALLHASALDRVADPPHRRNEASITTRPIVLL